MVNDEKIQQEGIDSKALLTCLIKHLPMMLTLAVTGAIIGSGLNLILAIIDLATPLYVSETEYYIDFADGRYEARDFYNAATWNDVIASDLILGNAMPILGDSYEREEIKNMITATIWSDVRYLKITILGENINQVSEVRDALNVSLEGFGKMMEEFDAIYLIEDSGIEEEKPELFYWRAAFLGAVIMLGIGIFVIAFRFCTGECIYTKEDILKYFGIPAYGLLYSEHNNADGRQEKMLAEILKKAVGTSGRLVFTDAEDDIQAMEFIRKLDGLAFMDGVRLETLDRHNIASASEVIMVIPFGVPCRTKVADEINYLRLLGFQIKGAVLANTDKSWTRFYYNYYNKK